MGLWMLVQSPGKGCSHIKNSMNKHMTEMWKKVQELSDEDFKTCVDSVLTITAEKDKNANEELARYWSQEFATHKYLFDRQDKECQMLKEITKQEFQ